MITSSFRLGILLGALLLGGCASSTPSVAKGPSAPTLTHRALSGGRVALLPVAARAEQVPLYDLLWLDRYLGRSFDIHVPGVPRVSNDEVRRTLAEPDAYEAVITLARTSKVNVGTMRTLGERLGARYVVFTTVDYIVYSNPVTTLQMGYGQVARELSVAADAYSSVSLDARIVIIDTEEGRVCWESEHGIVRQGAVTGEPHAQKLAWTVFSVIFGRLPAPEHRGDGGSLPPLRLASLRAP